MPLMAASTWMIRALPWLGIVAVSLVIIDRKVNMAVVKVVLHIATIVMYIDTDKGRFFSNLLRAFYQFSDQILLWISSMAHHQLQKPMLQEP